MPTFCDILKEHCSAETQQRGMGFFQGGRVRSVVFDDESIQAQVRGDHIDVTVFEFYHDDGEMDANCSCHDEVPSGFVCKHVWALACYLDAHEHLVPESINAFAGFYNHGERFDPEGEDDWDEDEIDESAFVPLEVVGRENDDGEIPPWHKLAQQIQQALSRHRQQTEPLQQSVTERELRYEIPVDGRSWSEEIPVVVRVRQRLKSGEWGKWKELKPNDDGAGIDPAEWLLAMTVKGFGSLRGVYYYNDVTHLTAQQARAVLPRLCATHKLFYREGDLLTGPLQWDDGVPWHFRIAVVPKDSDYEIQGEVVRGTETRLLSDSLSVAGGMILWSTCISQYQADTDQEAWLAAFVQRPPLVMPESEIQQFLESVGTSSALPPLSLPPRMDALQPLQVTAFKLALLQSTLKDGRHIPARFLIMYGDQEVSYLPKGAVLKFEEGNVGLRDSAAESVAWERLWQLGAKELSYFDRNDAHLLIPSKQLPDFVQALSAEGWEVYAQEKLYRTAGSFSIAVKSGIDWFDLQAECDFGGQTASLPALLKAVRNKERWVELGDGTLGMLPDEWLAKWAPIATLGEVEGDAVRFKTAQAGLLDAWLMDQPDVDVDEAFDQFRQRLTGFAGVQNVPVPRGFQGTLRPYQKDGLGWFDFLRAFDFGGCLADDMGLGKTVQVLALLESRRTRRKKNKWPPSLIVVPRSLMFNWIEESQRFTPRLRMLDHTGTDRELEEGWQKSCDAVLTTYGTLRRDIGLLKEFEFDYIVLDESQAIKNTVAQTTKAVRLLKGRHRLAMSGTPIENHLGELWSLMQFLNPGVLGSSSRFTQQWGANPDPKQREALARAMRPFILRRTKKQVATELPDRQEDTLHCELPPEQQKKYDELLAHYRTTLLKKVDSGGFNRNKIHVLEALLRLRQAACHPSLVSKAQDEETDCGKFDVLLPRIEELLEEGHKALVFSQFTSFLALLRKRLDKQKIAYEYLDGKTTDRQSCVNRFQEDPSVPLFLISLKAGGLGLNLTAADYVFLLDPWWNPAVEAQAIDRAHRIGQENKVMAYRLIAAGTVEDKVLELQRTKRELADAILSEDKALIKNLTRDDLELLLSSP